MTKVTKLYFVATVWGLIYAGIDLVVSHHTASISIYARVLLFAVTGVILLLAGRFAKQMGAKPARVGMLTGIIFGIFSGWSSFGRHITRSELVRSLQSRHLSTANVAQMLQSSNSAVGHVVSWAGAIIGGLVLGLILGVIGGITTKIPSEVADV